MVVIQNFQTSPIPAALNSDFYLYPGLPRWLSGKEPTCWCRRHEFEPWIREIPWRRKWQPTPIFLPAKSHGQRSLVGYCNKSLAQLSDATTTTFIPYSTQPAPQPSQDYFLVGSSVQSLSCVWLFVTPWTTACQASLSITNSRRPPKPIVHRVCDAIQSPHPLSSPFPPAFNLSQNQGLFKWISSLHQVTKVLEFQLQNQSYQWTPKDWSPLGWTGWISLQSKGLSRVFSNTTVQKLQFSSAQFSL